MRRTTRPLPNATDLEPRVTGAAAFAGVMLPVEAPSAESTAAVPAAIAAATAPSTSARLPTRRVIPAARRMKLAGVLGGAKPGPRPDGEDDEQREGEPEREHDLRRLALDEAATRLEDERQRVQAGDRVDPAAQQVERHIHRREEERHEDRGLHERPGLDGSEPHRDAAGPQQSDLVEDDREAVHAEEVQAVSADLHAGGEPDTGENDGDHRPAHERRDRVAGDDPAALWCRDQEA